MIHSTDLYEKRGKDGNMDFYGSIDEYIRLIRGVQGEPGEPGAQGEPGIQGEPGEDGFFSAETEVYKIFDATGAIEVARGQTSYGALGASVVWSGMTKALQTTLLDDTALAIDASFLLGANRSRLEMSSNAEQFFMAFGNFSSGPQVVFAAGVTNGGIAHLNGTTGTDGNLTVAFHQGVWYIENRAGFTLSIAHHIIGLST